MLKIVNFSVCLLAFFSFSAYAQYLQKSPTGGIVDWTNYVIREIGIGMPNPNMPIAVQRAKAVEAAKREAFQNLLERVKGMCINSEITIQQYIVTNDIIRNKVEGLVRNFRVIDTRYKSDGSVEVEVEIPITGILEAVLTDQLTEGIMPYQISPGTAPSPASPVYTGLIIDARGLGVRPALAPKILDENNQEIYGTGRVSRGYALQIGVVGYERNLNRALAHERVKNNPLIVKAIGSVGTNNTDVIISQQDAERIRVANQNLNFLQQCKVMFIID